MIATSNQYIILKSIPSINYRELKTKFEFQFNFDYLCHDFDEF